MFSQLQIQYPDYYPDVMQINKIQFEKEAKMAMAVKLFEMRKLSSGMAAILAGIDRVSFLLNLHNYGVNMIDLDEEDTLNDIENA